IACFRTGDAKVIGTGIDLSLAARADDVARTILVVAKKRAAALDPLFFRRLRWIERGVGPFGISRYAAGFGQIRVVVRPVPIAAPLPDVARHVVEAISVRRKFRHGRESDVTIPPLLFDRERSLVG